MFCNNCGKQIPDGSKFCIYCGAKMPEYRPVTPAAPKTPTGPTTATAGQVRQQTPRQPQATGQQVSRQPQAPQTPKAPKVTGASGGASSGKKILIPVICAVVLIVAAVAAWLVFFRAPTIDLNKYISVEFEGQDGKGTATAKFLNANFLADNEEKIMKAAKKAGYNQGSAAGIDDGQMAVLVILNYTFTYSVTPESGLQNGDTVKLIWDVKDDYVYNLFGIKLKHKDKTFSVSGLTEAPEKDLFDYVSVSFDGTNSNGVFSISWKNSSADTKYGLKFKVDRSTGLKNGDKVTVTVYQQDGKDVTALCKEKFGFKPKSLTKTYTVTGLH